MNSAESPDLAPPASLRDVRWRFRDLVIGFSPVILVDVLASIDRGGIRDFSPAWSWIPPALLSMAWFVGWPLLVARRLPVLPEPRGLLVESCWALLATSVVMVTLVGVSLILPKLPGPQGPSNPFGPIAGAPDRYQPVALLLLAVVVAPIAEETFFRGMLYNALRRRMPFVLAAVISGAVFGLMHPFGIVERVSIATVGFLLAMLYEWRKTLAAPILLHGMVNSLGMAMLFYSVSVAANAPALGVRGEPGEEGCVLTEVIPGGAAAGAGLLPGDVITGAGENSVRDLGDLILIVRAKKLGDRIPVWYRRGGEPRQVDVVLKPRPQP